MTDVFEKMEALKAQAVVCTDCGLAETRLNVVFGNGDPTSKLVIVAEGPSATDEHTLVPFSGPSGVLLDEVLHANDLDRDEIWITNVLRCRAAIREGPVIKNRPPKAGEIKACSKWLDGELTLISPSVILCMGSPAANTLIHKGFRMTEERGQWFTDTLYTPFVLATYNPAFVLRQDGEAYTRARQALIDDIAKAKHKLSEAPDSPKLTLF